MVNSIPIITISLLAAAFFSGMEAAFVSSDKLRLELNKTKDSYLSGLIGRMFDNTHQFTATLLVGNLLSLIMFSFAAILFFDFVASIVQNLFFLIVIQVTVTSAILLFMGDLLPKVVFSLNPNKVLNIFSIPAALFFILFYPLTWICMAVAQFLSDRWYQGLSIQLDKKNLFSKIRQKIFTIEAERSKRDTHTELESEIKLFKNALAFTKIRVRDCMVQRPDMEIMDEFSDLEDLRRKFTETGYSKILIYKDHIDNIIGYVHSFDLFNQPENISLCLREVSFVPETMEAKKLLSKLLKEHKSIAVVVDEFGGTAGMITTEDILEEIFGEIEDEHDKPDFIAKKINDNRYVFSGRLEIETINEMYGLDLEVNASYETMAGYILYRHSSFPKTNSTVRIGKYEFTILRSSRTSIDLVEMRILEK